MKAGTLPGQIAATQRQQAKKDAKVEAKAAKKKQQSAVMEHWVD